ncbi:MAG TPA: acyl carrier protein [Vicinamibacterales bacterium]|nr:acyl carrier protein [Vicinamibacterales bacterium]
MTSDEIRTAAVDVLGRIAPEIAARPLDAHADLRDELDLDSMDFLRFVLALHERFGIEVPESDYPQLATLDRVVAYLAARCRPEPSSTH